MQSRQGTGAPPSGYVLIGRSIIAAPILPEFRPAEQPCGTDVVSVDGQELRGIDWFSIDVDRGYVAYVLVS